MFLDSGSFTGSFDKKFKGDTTIVLIRENLTGDITGFLLCKVTQLPTSGAQPPFDYTLDISQRLGKDHVSFGPEIQKMDPSMGWFEFENDTIMITKNRKKII